MTRKEVLNTATYQQETYYPYLCRRRSMFKSALSRTSGLQQLSYRHQKQTSQDHTLHRPMIEPTTKGQGDSSNELRKHSHLVKQQKVSFPAATSWSGQDERSRDLRDL